MVLERLQKVIAQSGVCSRRQGEELILSGRVSVNGEKVTKLGTKVNPEKDKIFVDGKRIKIQERYLYIFHKPRGVVTTMYDPEKRPCVADYLRRQNLPVKVFPVGRLDFDVSGVLLLTNDGEFANKLMHPRYGVKKTYWALVAKTENKDLVKNLLKGVMLDDGQAKVLDAKILRQSELSNKLFGSLTSEEILIEVIVQEGRKHFVKRILQAAGHPAKKLSRVSFGHYRIGRLDPGQIRGIPHVSQSKKREPEKKSPSKVTKSKFQKKN